MKSRQSQSFFQENLWPILIGCILPLLVIITPSNKTNLAEHMFSKSFIIQIYIALLALFYVILRGKERLLGSKHPLAIVLYLTIIWGACSLFWAENAGYGIVQLMRWVSGLILAFLVFQHTSKKQQRLILQLFFAGTVLLALMGIGQYLFDLNFAKQAAKPAATFANKNMAAQVAVLTWLLGPYLLITSDSKNIYKLCFYAVGSALSLSFIFYTQTQAAWLSVVGQVSLLVILAIAAFVKKLSLAPNWSSLHKTALVIASIVFVILINVNDNGIKPFWVKINEGADKLSQRTSGAASADGQAAVRFLLWEGAYEMAKDNPVKGIGLANYYQKLPEYASVRTWSIRTPHNDYLQSAAEMGFGIFALIIASWFILGFLFFKWLITDGAGRFRDIILIVCLGGMAITSLFSFPLQLQTPILLIAAFLGLILQGEKLSFLASNNKHIFTGLFAMCFVVVLIFNISWNAKLNEFNTKVNKNDWKETLDFNVGKTLEHPMNKWLALKIVDAYKNQKMYGSAYKVAQSYLDLEPENPVLLNRQSYTLIQMGRYDEAESLLKKAREHEYYGFYESYYNAFILYTETKDLVKLRKELSELSNKPNDTLELVPQTLENMAVAHYQLKEHQKAIALLKRSTEIFPEYEKVYSMLVTILNEQGKKEEAEHYKEALQELRLKS